MQHRSDRARGVPEIGKGFGEPTIHTDLARRVDQEADAVVLTMKAVIEHAQQHPQCMIDLEIPYKKGRGTDDPALSFAKALIAEGNCARLERL